MILVTGATGQYGTKVIEQLLNKGVESQHIAALVRDAAKGKRLQDQGIKVRVGDYTDIDSLINAFQGVDELLLVSSNDRGAVANRTAQHVNAIRAAKEAHVKHLVYTSFARREPFADSTIAAFLDSHAQTEQAIEASGLAYTILQNGIYLEMIPIFVGKAAETGAIVFPAQEGKASWVLRAELAEAAAQVLTTQGHKNKRYVLTNTVAISFSTVAKELSNVMGKEMHYESPRVEQFKATLEQAGVPELYVGMFAAWAGALAEGVLDIEDTTLASFLGRKPTTTAQFISQVYR